MSTLEERTTDKLADMILNILWQDLLEVWRVLKQKLDTDGPDSIQTAFNNARDRFLEGPFVEHIDVRWGMNQCLHCNDDNIEKNGLAYLQPNGDGLEFNQCLNCRIGLLYKLDVAKAKMERYVIQVGQPNQFNGMSLFWVALVADPMGKFQPMYELLNKGEWIGTLSFDEAMNSRYLPVSATTGDTPRDSEDVWTSELPDDVRGAAEAFVNEVRFQIEVALAAR